MINEVLYRKPPYDTLRDFAPVTLGASLPNVLTALPTIKGGKLRALGVTSGKRFTLHPSPFTKKCGRNLYFGRIFLKGSPADAVEPAS